MTLTEQFRICCFALTLFLYIILGIAHAEQLTITQDPGVIGEPISICIAIAPTASAYS